MLRSAEGSRGDGGLWSIRLSVGVPRAPARPAPPSRPSLGLALLVGTTLALITAQPARGQVSFEEVTPILGTAYVGPSWGASWVDLDGDGWPDLYASNHGAGPSLYVATGDGDFSDLAP